MKMLAHRSLLTALLGLAVLCSSAAAATRVVFSPGAEAAIVAAIDGADKEIRVQAFSFTSRAIAGALIAAHERHVDVQLLVDRGQESARGSLADECKKAGITVLTDAQHAIAHNKILIVDRRLVETGSFNYTEPAEHRNAENALFVDGPENAQTVKDYLANWDAHAAHCTPFKHRADAKPKAKRRAKAK